MRLPSSSRTRSSHSSLLLLRSHLVLLFFFLDQDTLFDDLVEMIQTSPCNFVQAHGWAAIPIQEGQKKKPITVGAAFKVNLA